MLSYLGGGGAGGRGGGRRREGMEQEEGEGTGGGGWDIREGVGHEGDLKKKKHTSMPLGVGGQLVKLVVQGSACSVLVAVRRLGEYGEVA